MLQTLQDIGLQEKYGLQNSLWGEVKHIQPVAYGVLYSIPVHTYTTRPFRKNELLTPPKVYGKSIC